MHVLFVCNSNVCRSVIAERLTRAFAAEHGLPGLTAESAGTRALVGFPPEPLAADTVAGLGGDATGFTARKLRPEMVDRADLVLTMTEQLREQVGELAFGAAPRTFTLLEAHRIAKVTGAKSIAGLHRARNDLAIVGRENIADPIGLSPAAFVEVGDRIAEALFPLLHALAPHEQTRLSGDERGGLIIEPRGQAPLATFLAAHRTR
ncbi:arsenate reductase/protein-tyrosine-phosphatase family protein [Nocardia thailandica]|uniref:Low molecular weight phosphatase family protein n=1 Tax=Nocardia thailandica TaxID=257275 RepID=A0ABW6PR43_9NOCA|nr:protein-tyrosine-phosphatase [Nocardia thailandica]